MRETERASPLARYLFVAYGLLVIYASLHPFSGWRDPGVAPLAFLTAPLPRYLTAFDLAANFVAYAPLGFFAALALVPVLRRAPGIAIATLLAACLSLALEGLQNFLPVRIPSNLDLLTNTAGAFSGALAGAASTRLLLRDGGLQTLRYRVFLPGGRIDLGVVLLALWLVSQLNPETLLFGNGDLRELFHHADGMLRPAQSFMRTEAAVAGANALALGMLLSGLVGRAQPGWALFLLLVAAALAVRTIAFGVLMTPQDMLLWVTPGALYGLAAGTLVAIVAMLLPRVGRLALAGLALMGATVLVNLAPENPYLASSLAQWRQGHFLNFNGLTRVLSAAWPFAALAYVMALLADRSREH